MTTIDEWQARLHQHFTDLKAVRPEDRPIFAIEHGLNEDELADLKGNIVEAIASRSPRAVHSLPWVVHASEIGYRFSGDEYWQTFAEETSPAWHIYGDRDLIRSFFRRFHAEYRGVKPSDAWAEHFGIICWPIANAILPLDLQRHLARILYSLRHRFRLEFFESPELLGARIQEESWSASGRFRTLARENLLVGQIASALLTQTGDRADSLILPSTLDRIAADLERESQARHWIKSAAESAQAVKARGLTSTAGTAEVSAGAAGPERRRELALEPRVELRRSGSSAWDVFLQLPDLRPLLRFPRISPVITNSRVTVSGSVASSPRARGWLLRGPQIIRLARWPYADETVLEFEDSIPDLEYLLSTDLFSTGVGSGSWIFKVRDDGSAQRLASRMVRPGSAYVFLSTDPSIEATEFGDQISINCEGIHGRLLNVPEIVDDDWSRELDGLGLAQARGVEVWPIGLPAARWDGEGHAEFSTGFAPRFGIRVDSAIERIHVRLDHVNAETAEIPFHSSNIAVVELPELSSGAHHVDFLIDADDASHPEPLGRLEVVIRERASWSGDSHKGSPLVVIPDPARPSLEDLWSGEFTLEAHGPSERQVRSELRMFEKREVEPFRVRKLPNFKLPMGRADWNEYFEDNVRNHKRTWTDFDRAYSVELFLNADELGTFSLDCERDYTSIRWVIEAEKGHYVLRLVDDTDRVPPKVQTYEFQSPDVPQDLDSDLAPGGFTAPEQGALFVARAARQRRAVVVPPYARTFDALRQFPILRPWNRTVDDISRGIDLINLWFHARAPGDPLARALQFRVVRALHNHMFGVICGWRWAGLERRLLDDPTPESQRQLLEEIPTRRADRSFAGVVDAKWFDLFEEPMSRRVTQLVIWHTNRLSIAGQRQLARGGGASIRWLAEFALRLASNPQGVKSWASDELGAGIKSLLDAPTLARTARFLVVAIAAIHESEEPTPLSRWRLYAGWDWQ